MNDEGGITMNKSTGPASARCFRHPRRPSEIRHHALGKTAFTLVEIVVALTIVIIIAAGAIPTMKGLRAEQAAREPIVELTRLAKLARLRAMREKRPYQIVIHETGFTASRYLSPYLQLAGLTEFLEEIEQKAKEPPPEKESGNEINASRQTGDQVIYTKSSSTNTKFDDWTEDYKLGQGTRCSVQLWYESTPVEITGDVIRLWVFQPSGICQPLTLSLTNESAALKVEYGALTADIIKESSDIK